MNKKAFTLIELLIVVLIIAILAAIAIPNFMEFQTRAKVSRVKSDMRSIATGMEAYCVDEGTYPAGYPVYIRIDEYTRLVIYTGLFRLTSPIAYMTSIPQDSFGDKISRGGTTGEKSGKYFEYGVGKAGVHSSGGFTPHYPNDAWMLESTGPDNTEDSYGAVYFASMQYPWPTKENTPENWSIMLGLIYDPTNGTVSRGQIYRAGGVAPGTLVGNAWFQIVSFK